MCTDLVPYRLQKLTIQWKQDASLREVKVMRRFHIQDREDYHKCAEILGLSTR